MVKSLPSSTPPPTAKPPELVITSGFWLPEPAEPELKITGGVIPIVEECRTFLPVLRQNEVAPAPLQEVYDLLTRAGELMVDMHANSKHPLVPHVGPGDAALTYDVSFFVAGREPVRVKATTVLHGVFTRDGLDTAPLDLDALFHQIATPIRSEMIDCVNEFR